jgi:hypothetical protein
MLLGFGGLGAAARLRRRPAGLGFNRPARNLI